MLFSQFKRWKDQEYYKNWTNETAFVYILDFIFMAFLAQKLSHTIYDLTLCLVHFLSKVIY